MTQAAPALLALVLVGVVGLLIPRLIARGRISFRVMRGLRPGVQERRADMSHVADYHDRLPAAAAGDAIDESTWRDLDLDAVFSTLDFTESQVGRQYLFHLLRTPRFSAAPLRRLEQAVLALASDDAVLTRLRDALGRLRDPRAAFIVALLFGDLPSRPRLWWIFPLLTASSFGCLALVAFWPRAAVIWLAVCATNICVQLYYKPRVRTFTPAYHEIPALLGVARQLGALQLPGLGEEVETLRDGARQLGLLRRATGWLLFEPGQTNEVAATIYEYLNLLFLFDVNAFVFGTQAVRDARPLLRTMFAAIGYIDAAQSIVSWRRSLRYWAAPEFTESRKGLRTEALYHPLLTAPVANSLTINDASVLITGSNMAGKTTFVRTLGVNAVLAQTLHTVCARTWRAPLLQVHSSIGRSDSLVDGKSHFLAEVESVRSLIQAKADGRQALFLLDELFQGTNTPERIAAAYAVLSFLDRGADIVVVATHDLEMLDMLGDAYAPYHFREQVDGDALTFDYLLQPGPSSTRNAIALLKLLRYPDAVIADALAAIEKTPARPRVQGPVVGRGMDG
jgi:MutS domain V